MSNIVLYESPEKEPCITILSDSNYVPKDNYQIVYIVFLLFGIANLLPWNVFITASDYFVDYKLNTTASQNASYPRNFLFAVGTVGQVTNVLMNLMNIFISLGG